MTKREINPVDYAGDILKALPRGILVNTSNGKKDNTMIIGWGTMGVEWSVPIFAIYIREGRFTRELLDESREFTVSIPYGEYDRSIVKICGAQTGRNIDKFKEAGLTRVTGEAVSSPAVKELPLTLECKVVFRKEQGIGLIDKKFSNMYPADVDSAATGANKDCHIAYYGEIVKAYIIED